MALGKAASPAIQTICEYGDAIEVQRFIHISHFRYRLTVATEDVDEKFIITHVWLTAEQFAKFMIATEEVL